MRSPMPDQLSNAVRPKWVDMERGLVSREIFVDEHVFHREQDRIFNRSWMYLAHESEIPKPGDYVSRALGSVPVIVNRDDGGGVNVVMNSCRHRGAKLCRA